MIYSLFLILNFSVYEGRLHIVNTYNNNYNIIIVSNHKVIKEKINKNIKIVGAVQIRGKESLYYPNSNKEYLRILEEVLEETLKKLKKLKIHIKLFYLNFKLISLKVMESD